MDKSEKKYKIPEREKLYKDPNRPADFEEAITATGWGKFHLLVIAFSIPCGWSSLFEVSTMSYVFPAAECDLNLTLEHKGLLNAVVYTGMITSGFMWGYVADILGRKKLLVLGYLIDGIFVLMSASSQNFTMLMISKFLGGVIVNGPFSALTTYLSELHCSKHRSKVQMVLGTIFGAGTLVLPILAVYVFSLDFNITLGKNIVIHSWNLYLFVCAGMPLISGIAFLFLPESPKFLMTTGQNEKAMRVFRKIYRINTGKPEDTFPIKVLINELELNQHSKATKFSASRTKIDALLQGWSQIKPLFQRPYSIKIIYVSILMYFGMNNLNTLRLWLPQLLQAINDYQATHNETAPLCEILEVFRQNKTLLETGIEECVVNTNNLSVYTNSMIASGVTIMGYIAAVVLINKIGKKWMYVCLAATCAISATSLYFSRTMLTTMVLVCTFIMGGSVISNIVLAVIVDMFPTTLRAMAISIAMSVGRLGPITGNLTFPYLLASGCGPPFFYLTLLSSGCALLGLLLPKTDFKALQ